MNDWFALALLLAVLGCWAGTLWAARSRIGEMQGRLDKARAEAARATGLLGQAMVRENELNAANAALRRALDEAEAAGNGRFIGTAVIVQRNALRMLDTVTGEKVLN